MPRIFKRVQGFLCKMGNDSDLFFVLQTARERGRRKRGKVNINVIFFFKTWFGDLTKKIELGFQISRYQSDPKLELFLLDCLFKVQTNENFDFFEI